MSCSVLCAVQESTSSLTQNWTRKRGIRIGSGSTDFQSHRVFQSARGQNQAQ